MGVESDSAGALAAVRRQMGSAVVSLMVSIEKREVTSVSWPAPRKLVQPGC
jgi:hypothetical protein